MLTSTGTIPCSQSNILSIFGTSWLKLTISQEAHSNATSMALSGEEAHSEVEKTSLQQQDPRKMSREQSSATTNEVTSRAS
jgi:hypothetical protein